MEVRIIFGASGTGKSTLATDMRAEALRQCWHCVHLEADMWHYRDGEYKWTLDEQQNAHQWCRLNFEKAIRCKTVDILIVSNTFTTLKELIPYFQICLKYNQQVELFRSAAPWSNDPEECFKRNIHKVPLDIIKAQMGRMHTLLPGIYSVDLLKEICQNYQKSS